MGKKAGHRTANWPDLLDSPDTGAHFVQLYTDTEALVRNVGRYLAAGIEQGECAIVIATADHESAFREDAQSRGADVVSAERERRLLFLDAEQTITRFVVNRVPDWARFEKVISGAFGSMPHIQPRRIRAYGEMVGILWASGQYSAAIRVEEFWNRILRVLGARLFCAYPIDVFAPEFNRYGVHSILCDHTHLLAGDGDQRLAESIRRAMNEVLGKKSDEANSRMQTKCSPDWGVVPASENMILWLRESFPNFAGEILRRAQRYYGERPLQCACPVGL